MLRKKRFRWNVFFAGMSVLTICFIFSNSLKNGIESGAQSARVAEFLRRILDPNHQMDEELFHFCVRKLAHFAEFSALGFWLKGADLTRKNREACRYALMPIILSFGVALTDEFIQGFTDRTSSIRDVILDFCGALFGIFVIYLLTRMRRRKGAKLR